MNILFIGAGNMGQAIIGGVISNGVISASNISIYEVNVETRKKVISQFKVNEYNTISDDISKFDIILMAVKPQIFATFYDNEQMSQIKNYISNKQTIITIMAGISIAKIQGLFGNIPVVRVMPNTAALVGESMSVLSYSAEISQDALNNAEKIFKSIGKTEILDEKYLDAVTGLSGAGPAYIYLFIEALTQGGILSGLNKQVSEKLAIQTMLGSLKMIDGSKTIEDLRHMVTSPGGSTIAGIATLERRGVRSAIMDAVKDATDRTTELGKN